MRNMRKSSRSSHQAIRVQTRALFVYPAPMLTVTEALARACALYERTDRPSAERARLRRELEAWEAPAGAWGDAAAEVVRLALQGRRGGQRA